MRKKAFGQLIRREREARGIGLREMTRKLGISPAYLSKIERGEFPPPAEDKVRAIAKIIDFDQDELLALAGRVASDLGEIIRSRPKQIAHLIRWEGDLAKAVALRFGPGRGSKRSPGMSPWANYVEVSTPAIDVRMIAKKRGRNVPELLKLAGALASDYAEIMRHHPREMTDLLSAARGLSVDEMVYLVNTVHRQVKRRPDSC